MPILEIDYKLIECRDSQTAYIVHMRNGRPETSDSPSVPAFTPGNRVSGVFVSRVPVSLGAHPEREWHWEGLHGRT